VNNVWLYIVVCGLALIGLGSVARGIQTVCRYIVVTATSLISALKDAAEVARAYREDLAVLKQIAQMSPPQQGQGDEPESIIPKPPIQDTMPAPYFSRFPVKPHEEDAPLESVSDVDLTPTAEDLLEQEKGEQASDLEAQERQKAATREADQARLRELAEQSGEPEGQ
jgi:hypothetical protein